MVFYSAVEPLSKYSPVTYYIFLLLQEFLMKTLIVMTKLIFVHRTVTKSWIRQEISLGHYKHKPQPEKQNKNRTKLGLRPWLFKFLCPPIYDRPDIINYADLSVSS